MSPHRDCTISANTSRGVRGCLSDFASCSTTSWIRVVCEVIWVVVGVCRTGHLSPWATNRDPLVDPAASAMTAVSQSWFCWSGQTDLHPIGWQGILENFFIHKGDHHLFIHKGYQQLHHPPELQCTLCQMVRLTWDWWLSLLHPVLKGLCIGEGLLWLCKLVVLTAELQIWRWHKPVFLQG